MKIFYFKIKLIFLLLFTGYSMFGQDTCCLDQFLFIELAQNVQTNGELGDCQIHFLATGMNNCMQITWDFGDGTVVGPFGDNTPVSHIYSGSNTYTVCYIIEEVNQNGVCWNYTQCEDVLVLCDSCCNSYDLFCLNIMNGVNVAIDNELCKAILNVDDIPACNYLEYVDWGDASPLVFGPFTNGDMPMHTYTNSGTYIISYLAIEEDPNDGSICFEKIIYDTITLECSPCCKDFDEFCDLINLGWQLTINEMTCEVTITMTQFDSCHWLLTDGPDWHEGPPPQSGNYTANGTWTHTYNQSGTYVICALIAEGDGIDFCWEKYLCDTIDINCGPCDTNAITASLTGYFPFDASANDESSTQIHGIVNGATLTNGYDAAPNSAYHFNGSSNSIFAGTGNRSISDKVTIAAWVRTTEQVNGQWIAGKYSFYEDHGYHLTIGDNGGGSIGKVAFSGRDGTSVYHSSGFSSTMVNDGKWHCIVGTAGNGVWSIYVDGVLENSAPGGTSNLATSSAEPFTIGRHTNSNFPLWMNGDIDDVMVFNRTLSANEIMNCICGGFKPHYEYCACPEGNINGPNLVTNGNFSLGDNFFTSIGTGNPCQCTAGTYCVDDFFTDKCSGWPPVQGLPGGGNNNFLILDGHPSQPATLWSQQVNVVPCMTYCFSFSTASVYPPNQQNFDLDIVVYDGTGAPVLPFVGSNVPIIQTTPPWSNHSFTWTAPCNVVGPFTIAINQVTGSAFNDFGIDDICFTKTCACPAGTIPGPEMVINSDFEGGYFGFTSDYSLLNPTCAPGTYKVTSELGVTNLCNNWYATDHSTSPPSPLGQFFVADGSQTPGQAAWRQGPYSLIAGTKYSFCAWVNNLNQPVLDRDDPIVEVYLLNTTGQPGLIVSSGALSEVPDLWINLNTVVVAPTTGTYFLEFRTASTSYEGNNFAIDDISLMECSGPPPPDSCCGSFDNFYQKIGSLVSINLDNSLCKVTFDLSDLPPCDSIGWIDWGDGSSELGNFGSGDMPMHTYSGSGFYFIQYSAIEYDLSTTPPTPCLEWVFVYTFHLDCSDCECHSDLVLTHGNNSYPVTCDPHTGFLPSFGCPLDTVSISGFFGCGDSITWDPCLETEVTWSLSLDNNPIDGGITSNYSVWIFPPSLVGDPGVYSLILTTVCPGSIDTCVCEVSWVQEPCDSCICLGNMTPAPNYVINGNFGQGDNYFTTGLTMGSMQACQEGSYWVDDFFDDKCNGWPTFQGLQDGSLGTFNFLIIDGEEFDPGSTLLWSQQVNIIPNDWYCFSIATRSGFPQQNFNLDVVVFDGNNNPLIPIVGQPGVYGGTPGWVSQSFTWQAPAGATGSFTLGIIQNASAAFTDFGIDDICFTQISPPDSCCSDYDLFCQNVMNATSVTVDNSLCKATLNIGNLPSCESIAWVNWGQGPIQNGPFTSGNMPMYTYSGSGTYFVSYLAEEYDYSTVPPTLCFEKLLIDTISINCISTPDTCDFNPCLLVNSIWDNLSNNHFIMDMIVYQGQLIVAGSFNIGGARNIAAWDGTSFNQLGAGTDGTITSLAIYNGELYVGGGFSMAGTGPANNIAKWNGSWSPLISGVNGVNSSVRSLQVYGSNLVAGGTFTMAGSTPANNIASWNASTSTWSTLNGMTGPVNGLGLYNGQLVAGGIFLDASGNLSADNIALWDATASAWTNLGQGITLFPANNGQGVKAILQLGSELIVGGRFDHASGASNTNFIARWNGTNWSSLSTGVNASFEGIYDLKIYGGQIYAGGLFTQIGTNSISGVARWDGTNWNTTNHPDRLVHALECYFVPDETSDLFSAGEVFINRWVCIVGTDEISRESLHIYPNPTTGDLIIELSEQAGTGMSLRVISLAGQILFEKNADIGKNVQHLNAGNLPDGMYFIQLVSDNRILSINKFVKL